MKAMFTAIKRSPKLAVLSAAFVAAVVVPASLLAWGPERPLFTIENPANYVTFNSITNNPNIGGDERNFVNIRETGTNNLWTDNQDVVPGKSYTVRMYVHNNAASNLNLVAQNVRASFNLPTTTAKSIQVDGFLRSSNAQPQEVYDQAKFLSDQNFNLDYVEGSLQWNNNATGPAGVKLPESVFTNAGALLGYDKLDGKIPGCFQYDGYLTFVVKPQFASAGYEVKKEVRKSGTKEWSKSVNVNPGDSVDYQLYYKNTSNARQNNVLMQDSLPAGLTYTNGTSYLANKVHPNGLKLLDDITKPQGVNIGDYQSQANAYVKFSAKVTDESLVCGTKTYVNKIRVTVNENSYKEDTANVVVTKPCAPGETPVTELPQTGVDGGVLTAIGLGIAAAGAAYAANSTRVRNLIRG